MSAIVIGLMNEKGGVGKSTIAINIQNVIANMADENNQKMNLDVLLVDADDQETTIKATASRSKLGGLKVKGKFEKFDAIECVSKKVDLENYVEIVKNRHDFIVIDTKGADSESSREVISFANIIVIPLSPYGFDKQSLANTLENIKKAKKFNKDMLVLIVFNKVDKSATAKNREGREEVNETIDSIFAVNGKTSADWGVFLCETELSYKPRFYSEMSKGLTVFEAAKGKSYDPKTEYDNFMNEIQNLYAQVNSSNEVAA
ncbi:TPA: ParA family protein [Pseudomonas aeruginosa]|nr:ParA family protein [Pseudomonas aeruginosa]